MRCSYRRKNSKVVIFFFFISTTSLYLFLRYGNSPNGHLLNTVNPEQAERHREPSEMSMNLPKTITSHNLVNGRFPKQVDEGSSKNGHKNTTMAKGSVPEGLNHTSVESIIRKPRLDALPSISGPNSLEILQQITADINRGQTMYNQDKFPSDHSLVLMVQVHKRDGYLKQLLESLRVARGIEDVLLIISHDHYYDTMNKIIHSIDFCKVSGGFWSFVLLCQ